MRNELHPCTKESCWIPALLVAGYDALWPLKLSPEKRDKYFVWTFYVRWRGGRGSRANNKWICEKHHKQILAMWDADMRTDLQNMEVTERWLTRVKSQMLRRPTG